MLARILSLNFIMTLCFLDIAKPNQLTSELTVEIIKNINLEPPFLVIVKDTFEFKTKVQKQLAQFNIFVHFDSKMNKESYYFHTHTYSGYRLRINEAVTTVTFPLF